MPVIRVTQADKAKIQNVAAGWYPMQVTKVLPPVISSKGNSVNYVIEFTVEGAVTNGGIPVPGKVIPYTLNTILLGKIDPLAKALIGKEVTADEEFDLDQFMGKKCDGKIGQREYEGQLIDEIQTFLPLGKSREAAPF